MKWHFEIRRRTLGLIILLGLALSGCGGAASAAPGSSVERGAVLFKEFGCITCHAITKNEKEKKIGPALVGVYGQPVRLNDGREVKVDEDYIRQSILQPDAATVEGYQVGVMAAGIERFKARIESPGTVDVLVEYIKSLR